MLTPVIYKSATLGTEVKAHIAIDECFGDTTQLTATF